MSLTDRAPLVVGIDPSLTATGIAISTGSCFKVGYTGITVMPVSERIRAVDELVFAIIGTLPSADLYVIERPTKSKFSAGVLERGALWWLLVRELIGSQTARLAVVMPANRMTYATGKGLATKGAVVDAVARRLPQFETKGDDNCADAAIFCAMGMDHLGHPLAAFPATHRKALNAVDWPACPPWDEP